MSDTETRRPDGEPLRTWLSAQPSRCDECGHVHTGKKWSYICIGCPCENYPSSPRNTGSAVKK